MSLLLYINDNLKNCCEIWCVLSFIVWLYIYIYIIDYRLCRGADLNLGFPRVKFDWVKENSTRHQLKKSGKPGSSWVVGNLGEIGNSGDEVEKRPKEPKIGWISLDLIKISLDPTGSSHIWSIIHHIRLGSCRIWLDLDRFERERERDGLGSLNFEGGNLTLNPLELDFAGENLPLIVLVTRSVCF